MRTKKEKPEDNLEEGSGILPDAEILNSIKIEVGEDDVLTKESDDLFQEFNSFLEEKAKMVPDSPEKRPTISTGIRTLDAILGGGFAVGALNIVVGQPGSGKSMLAAQTLGRAQQIFKGKLLGGYLDSEESMTKERLSSLGVNFPPMTPYSDMTVEKVFRFLEGMCLFKEKKGLTEDPSVIVWDSIANTLSEKEREADDPNTVLGYKARMLSLLIPKYVAKAAMYKICVIAVNQYRDIIQIGLFKPPKDLKMMSLNKDMPGGNVLKFNAFHLVEMRVQSVIDSDKYGFEGIISRVKCVKNKLFTPNIELDIVGSFVDGFSDFWSGYNFMVETKRLTTGAWNYLVSTPHKKFRTKDAFEMYKTDEEFRNAFDESLKECIDTEIINKYSKKVVVSDEKVSEE